ncbi:Prolipoprotein diacylglyceryl transferase [hydrothermal vent metagenome]|uniref:Prolipoprotein diacylglyceryl transferase n=1 Tax=hydrothermal vent metagenome TaxID=652676 RepID=A0A1W1C9V3_9ZZZZ
MEHFIWNADPVLLHLGPLQLRWYGLLFVGSFFLGLLLLQWIFKREGKDPALLDTLLIYLLVGAVIGARLMHCFAYEPEFYLSHPIEILKIWKGGLASHGGLLGSIVAIWLFCRKYKFDFMWLISRAAIAGTITAACVRFGNFFNSEILGKPTDLPWAVIFERVDMVPRHPVQLYEAFSYLILFALMLFIYLKSSAAFATRILPGVFLAFMFTVRFLLEYTKSRQADYTWSLPITTGQALSLPFIFIGIVWIVWAVRKKEPAQ